MIRPFKITDYGVCEIEDILMEVSETAIVLTNSDDDADDLLISIPKREQTADEVERTHKFAEECIELLRHAPDCRLNFNKFIPAYHHHFGRQCRWKIDQVTRKLVLNDVSRPIRVADYGFTKLIELFEAIPTTIEITEDADGERILQLTDAERLLVLGEQISALIQNSRKQTVKLSELGELYRRQYGYALRPDNFDQTSMSGVVSKLSTVLRLEENEGEEPIVRLIDRSYVRALSIQVKDILADHSKDGEMEVSEFLKV